MVYRGWLDGAPAAASLKNSSVSLAVGPGYVVAWDLGGRLFSVFRGGQTHRRGLSGRMLHKWRDPDAAPDAQGPYDERQRAVAGEAEADGLLDECAALAALARDSIARQPDNWRNAEGAAADGRVVEALTECARFDAAAARADAARFREVYAPVGILPPDQYMSVVLQATTGCSFGTCTFCSLYEDPYRVKGRDEFARHVEDVRQYLGLSLSLRRQSVFLGAANALAVPMPRLLELFEAVRDAFPATPIHAFLDGFTGARKSEDDYRRLKGLGLQRVYIGLESGHDPLLAFVRKPATAAQALEAVQAVRASGVSVGVIVMIGLGGDRFAAAHAADTTGVVNAMALGPGDLVYFSDLVESSGSEYVGIAADADVRPLPLAQRLAQLRDIRSGLRFPGAPPKFARYDIREFVY